MSKGLLLIDIQNDYFPGGKAELDGAEKALKNTETALNYFRKSGLPVIHVQHISLKEGAAFFCPGTRGAEIHPALTPLPDEKVIIKHMPNSFCETNLYNLINELGISELVICGMMTHMCVDTTVRAARDFKIPVTLIKDACATKKLSFEGIVLSAEQVNAAYFSGLNGSFAQVVSMKEFLEK